MLKALQVHNRHRSAADPTKLTSLTMLTNPTTLTKLTNITKYSTTFLTYASSRQETTANSSKREQRTKTLFLKTLILLQSFHT